MIIVCFFSEVASQKTNIIERHQLKNGKFVLATIHRNNNTDEPERLNTLFKVLNDISNRYEVDVVLPLHPRTQKLLDTNLTPSLLTNIQQNKRFKIIPPASFLEMIALEKNCELVMTDSGGVQKEAFYFKKPCVILRTETEWVELVDCGSAIIADANEERILNAYQSLSTKRDLQFPSLYGDGASSEFICKEILKQFA